MAMATVLRIAKKLSGGSGFSCAPNRNTKQVQTCQSETLCCVALKSSCKLTLMDLAMSTAVRRLYIKTKATNTMSFTRRFLKSTAKRKGKG
eukprot:scaffold89647_cov14-Tisochrysis_lutea.AAC.1